MNTARKIGEAFRLGVALLASAHALAADEPEPRVMATIAPNPTQEDQSVQLRIEVEAPQSMVVFQPKYLAPDFVQIGAQPNYGGTATRRQYMGQSVLMRKVFYEYVLSPKKAGQLHVRNIQVKVGERNLRADDIAVQVLPAPAGARARSAPQNRSQTNPAMPPGYQEEEDESNPAAPNYGMRPSISSGGSLSDVPASFNSDFTVHASITKRKAYVGEPIVVEYWLYDYGDVRQVEIQKWPTFNGFWKDDLEITTRIEWDEVMVGNDLMRRAFIGRYALYGMKPGRVTIDKLVVRAQYLANSSSRQFGQGFFQSFQTRTGIHGSQDLSVEILPLPTEGRPEKFGGAVGRFTLRAEADKTTLAQHTPVSITLTLSGSGNFQAIDAIRLPLPADFELYESSTGSRNSTPVGQRRELETQKTFHYTLIPRKAGSFVIPAVSFAYFDTAKGTYQQTSSQPIELQITENSAGAQAQNTYASPSIPSGEEPSSGLQPLREEPTGKPWPVQRAIAVATALAAIANLFFALGWIRRRSAAFWRSVLRDPLAEAKNHWGQAKVARGGAWQASLEESLFSLAHALLQANPRGITRTELEQQWRDHGLPAPLFHRIHLTLDQLDRSRFSGTNDESAQRNALTQEVASILAEARKIKRKKL